MVPLIIANWKCNPLTIKEAQELFQAINKGAEKNKKAEIVVCPPFLFVFNLKPYTLHLKLGAQDCFWEQKGAYTGEISPSMLKDAGCEYVIVGHSERRKYFGETDEMISKKIKSVLEAGLVPIFCAGETEEERKKQETEIILRKQIIFGLEAISKAEIGKIVIAYEPVWAIGTGNPCSIEEAQKTGLFIRKLLADNYGPASQKTKIIYGGSVNAKNAAGYIREGGLEGLLVGGASLDPKEFAEIAKSVS